MKESDPLLVESNPPPGASPSSDAFPSLGKLLREGVVLPNVGSTGRDHLANERTFLAYVRTALSLTGVGLGILRWSGISNAAGFLVLLLGLVVLVTATHRYFSVMYQLSQQKFEPNVRSALGMVVLILAVIATLLALYFTHQL
jgi:putative membrane protein